MKIKSNNPSATRLALATIIIIIASIASASAQVKDFRSDEHLSPEVKTFLSGLNTGGPGFETLSPEQARAVLSSAQSSVKVDEQGIEQSQRTITSQGFTIELNIVRPQGVKGILPAFIFIHGSGWVLGDYPTHRRLLRDLVVGSGAVGIFINYTRTPEAAYPTAINEIYAATKWVSEHGKEIGIDASRLAIAGNSVGGNMTAVTTIMAKERKGPLIKAIVMLWPIVDADFETESYKLFGADRFLTTPLMKWMYDMYIPETSKRKQVYASPLYASKAQLEGFPPTLIQVAENDVLRDEGEAFGRKLSAAGVKTTTVRYNGVIHDWGLLNGLATIPQTKAALNQASSFLRTYLFAK